MPEYRIYTVGSDGHFIDGKNIECADDQEAIRIAQQAVDGVLSNYGREIVLSRDLLPNRPRSSAPAMYSVQELRAYADEHLDWARTARTDGERRIFLQMAWA